MHTDEKMAELVKQLDELGVRIVGKRAVWHQRAAHWLLVALTFGGQRRYLDDYVTTIGRTIYVNDGWDQRSLEDRYATLRHELVHVRQFLRFGVVPMAIAYLLLPLPLGLAWCRMRLEREAYEESIRVVYELGGVGATARLRPHVVRQFVSGSYGWMWPFRASIERWYDDFVATLVQA